MEQIEVFDYIDRACTVLDENTNGFARAAKNLTEFLESTFGNIDATIGVTSRIKSRDSLKEKILRNHLYKEYPADRLVFEMHDIIGVRLECRFFKDEQFLYDRILETFDTKLEDGTYSPSGKRTIRLKLDAPQPEKQRNGFDIYRIDGSVTYAGESYNFELQIKSLVNSFWSEIEHKLIYKNERFSQSDNLMKELLNSIHESLSGVDHQLNLIFDRFAGNSVANQRSQIESMLAIGLNEIYSAVVKVNTGISVSISEYSEAIVIYLLSASSYMRSGGGQPQSFIKKFATDMGITAPGADDNTNYSGVLINLMQWMRKVDYGSIHIGEKIELRDGSFEGVERDIARVLKDNINSDFHLNTFFHIFFSLERGNDEEDFADYVGYYADRIAAGKTEEQKRRTLDALSEVPAYKLPLESTLNSLAKIR